MGELWVHSPNMSSGYYRDPDQTNQCFVREGGAALGEGGGGSTSSALDQSVSGTRASRVWYRTGDLVRVLDPGELSIY